MRLASIIQTSSTRIPFKFDFKLLKCSSITCTKNIPVRFLLRGSRSIFSCEYACRGKHYHSTPVLSKTVPKSNSRAERSPMHKYPTVTCASRTEPEQEASTSRQATSTTADYASSLRTVGLCVFSAVAFGVGLGFKDGTGKASEFFAGYLLEQSLSVDNLFVFVLIFKYFKVPFDYQNRVLSYGIAGAIIFRLSLILLGTATLQRFEAVNLLLAAILLYSSFKLFAEEDEDTDLSDNFIVKICQKVIPVTSNYDGNRFLTIQDGVRKATPLLLTVAVIELSDIAFAVDSIPAVFGVTRDPLIVISSNLFAILGLRSYYTLISERMAELEYLQPAIGAILGFIGCKMIVDFFGFHISTEVSLGFVATSLTTGVLLSLMKKSD